MCKQSMIFYEDWLKFAETMTDEEQLEYFRAVLSYGLKGEVIDVSRIVAVPFSFIKGEIDRNKEEYSKIRESRQKAGKIGSNLRWNNSAENNAVTPKQASGSTYSNPTLEECVNYFVFYEKTAQDAGKFFNYYAAQNWMVGNSLIYNWKAKADQWMSRDNNKTDKQIKKNDDKPLHQSVERMRPSGNKTVV
jgi:hypothetical protein